MQEVLGKKPFKTQTYLLNANTFYIYILILSFPLSLMGKYLNVIYVALKNELVHKIVTYGYFNNISQKC